MNKWDMRTHEVAYLLNPAFCGRILYSTIKTYNEILNRAFPFPLIYLVLPLVLHKQTRINISSRTQLLVWVQKYSQLLIDFPLYLLYVNIDRKMYKRMIFPQIDAGNLFNFIDSI